MKRILNNNANGQILLSISIFIFLLISSIAFAIPNSLTLQGKLTNAAGASISGTNNFTFRIYDAFTDGNVLWEKANFNITTDANGVYDVILQNINLSFADAYYLGITIRTDNESTPRINLTSSPYAFRANISEALNPNASYGIGTSAPLARLHVNDSSAAGALIVTNVSGTTIFFVNGSSGKVGIGTTGPNRKLDIESNEVDSNGVGLQINNIAAGGNSWGIGVASSGDLNAAAGSLYFRDDTSGGSKVVIQTNGNVGIGTTSPGARLTVEDTTTAATIIVNSTGTRGPGISLRKSAQVIGFIGAAGQIEGNSNTNLALFADGVGNITFYTGGSGTEKMRIDSSGNVGIGTTSPSHRLTVAGGSAADVANFSSTGATARIVFSAATGQTWRIGSEGGLNFAESAGDRLFIQTGGNVGIGTTSPSTKLHIQGQGGATATLTVESTTNFGIITLKGSNGGNGSIDAGTSSDGMRIFSGLGNNLTFGSNGTPNKMILTDAGNVGIGTASPGQALHINRSGGTNSKINIEASGSGHGEAGINLYTQSEATPWQIFVDDSTANNLGGETDRLGFWKDSAVLVLDGSSGRVGIGTTAPLSLLHINDSSATGALRVTNVSGTTIFFVNASSGFVGIGTTNPQNALHISHAFNPFILIEDSDEAANSKVWRFRTGATTAGDFNIQTIDDDFTSNIVNRLTIKRDGNVGINTTTPANTLTVQGTLNVTSQPTRSGDLFVASSGRVGIGTTTPVEFLDVTGNGAGITLNNTAVAGGKRWRIVTSTNDLRFTEAGVIDTITLQAGGRVGIGTTAPLSLLHINNSGADGALRVTNVSGTTIFFVNGSSGFVGIGNRTSNSTDNNPNTKLIVDSGDAHGVYAIFQGGDAQRFQLRFGTSTSTANSFIQGFRAGSVLAPNKLLLNPDGGQVGINISNPAHTLTVQGTLNVSNPGTSGQLFMGSSGNVGIGTTTPSTALQVVGTANITNVLMTGNRIDINDGSGKGLTGQIGSNDDIGITGAGGPDTLSILTQGNFSVATNNVANPSRFFIGTDGNVGIGTTGPLAKLDVQTASRATAFSASDGTTWHDMILRNPNSTAGSAVGLFFETSGYHTNAGTGIAAIDAGGDFSAHLAFITRPNGAVAVERMRITDAGNVGIGNTIPNATLHVVGNMILKATSTSNASPILNISGNDGKTVCVFTINGDFQCNGTKSALVSTSFDDRKFYAIESPDVRHIDEGRAKLKNGFANVSIDPIFKETIENNYNVYLTPEGKTKALYAAEKAKDYFIVRDTAETNAVFSYIISAYRKGYQSKRFDSGSDIEIIATIDEQTRTTEIELSGNTSTTTTEASSPDAAIASNNVNETNAQSNVGEGQIITGNIINELGLETDLTNILEPSSNVSTTTSTTTEASSPDADVENNNLINENITNNNATSVGGTSKTADIDDDELIEISDNKFTINTIDEDEIIEKIEQKTKLDKDEIKRAIKFKHKEPVKDDVEDELEEETTQITAQVTDLDYITKVNGSIIIRLG